LRKEKQEEHIRLEFDIYRPRIRAIEREQNEAIATATDNYDDMIAVVDGQIDGQSELVLQANRILEFLKLTPQDLTMSDDEVKPGYCAEKYQESLGYLYDGSYLKIKAFIIGNRKPKNKYSLILVGRSLFSKNIIEYPYSYGIDLNCKRNFHLLLVVKDGDSISALQEYYTKRQPSILKETIAKHEEVVAEYEEAKQAYSLEEFAGLVEWKCPQCQNFYSIFDSFSICQTPQCYHHEKYIDMIKQEV